MIERAKYHVSHMSKLIRNELKIQKQFTGVTAISQH